MNWYKKYAQNVTDAFPSYVTKEVLRLTQNYTKTMPYRLQQMFTHSAFIRDYIEKYKIPYQNMDIEELFRVCTYIMKIEKNPQNIKFVPEEIKQNPVFQSAYKQNKNNPVPPLD